VLTVSALVVPPLAAYHRRYSAMCQGTLPGWEEEADLYQNPPNLEKQFYID
jgi:hypothetical protein